MKDGKIETILAIGAASAIAQETSKLYAGGGTRFFLIARSEEKLKAVAADLMARGAASVDIFAADLADFGKHEDAINRAIAALGRIDRAIIAHGILGDQGKAENDYASAEEIYKINFLSVVSILTPLVKKLKEQKNGKIIAISSVAGDRGRQSNFIYGSSKAALDIYLEGLRNALFPFGVGVLVVKPGFVDTPMTENIPKNPLFAKPDVIARGIAKADARNCHKVYLPFYWRFIMLIIRHIPEIIFKRLKL